MNITTFVTFQWMITKFLNHALNVELKNKKLFKPTRNMIFKGDGWSTKNERIKRQMRAKNKKLDARSNEMKRDTNVGGTLAPNVDGERVDSWSDAQKLAKSKGKNTDSYEPLVQKEKKGK